MGNSPNTWALISTSGSSSASLTSSGSCAHRFILPLIVQDAAPLVQGGEQPFLVAQLTVERDTLLTQCPRPGEVVLLAYQPGGPVQRLRSQGWMDLRL